MRIDGHGMELQPGRKRGLQLLFAKKVKLTNHLRAAWGVHETLGAEAVSNLRTQRVISKLH